MSFFFTSSDGVFSCFEWTASQKSPFFGGKEERPVELCLTLADMVPPTGFVEWPPLTALYLSRGLWSKCEGNRKDWRQVKLVISIDPPPTHSGVRLSFASFLFIIYYFEGRRAGQWIGSGVLCFVNRFPFVFMWPPYCQMGISLHSCKKKTKKKTQGKKTLRQREKSRGEEK